MTPHLFIKGLWTNTFSHEPITAPLSNFGGHEKQLDNRSRKYYRTWRLVSNPTKSQQGRQIKIYFPLNTVKSEVCHFWTTSDKFHQPLVTLTDSSASKLLLLVDQCCYAGLLKQTEQCFENATVFWLQELRGKESTHFMCKYCVLWITSAHAKHV